jgi:hypothetical protein
VAGSLAFLPQALSATTEENYPASRERRLERLAIHIAEHQDRSVSGVLDDGRQEATALDEVESVEIGKPERAT